MATNIEYTTRTIETITVTLPDDVIGRLTADGEVELVLIGRTGQIVRKLNYRDLRVIRGDGPGRGGW
jgi:hypothetical protein